MPEAEFGPFDVLSDVAHEYYIDGFSERAVDACRRWCALTQAAGDVVTSRYFRYIEAISLQELGRDAEAVEVAQAILADIGDGLEPVWRAKALSVLAEASVRLGQHGRAIAAMAEAHWLIHAIPVATYGHLSASMAVALALRAVNLLEEADETLSGIRGGGTPEAKVLVAQELALLSAYWGASLRLIGRDRDAQAYFAKSASRARRMVQLAQAVDNDAMVGRGEVIEAYATMHLADRQLAAARARAGAERFTARPELIETHLLHLVLAGAALDRGRFEEAREHLQGVIGAADAAGREMWAATARWALAEVHEADLGPHPAMDLLLTVARGALVHAWSEREGRFAALHDRHQLRELTAETNRIGRAVMQDPLTLLGNRRLLEFSLHDGLEHPWVVFVDIDSFKTINDTYSHAIGDDVLRVMADILRSESREEDLVIRFGGDEFLILPARGKDAALAVADRVHRAVEAWPWDRTAEGLRVTVSIGVGATGRAPGDPWAVADAALLAAKRSGRNRIVIGR